MKRLKKCAGCRKLKDISTFTNQLSWLPSYCHQCKDKKVYSLNTPLPHGFGRWQIRQELFSKLKIDREYIDEEMIQMYVRLLIFKIKAREVINKKNKIYDPSTTNL